jgi:Spy/CpxP family protein refolding chaperone
MMKLVVALMLGTFTFSAGQHDHSAMTSKAAGGTTTLSEKQVADLLAGEGMGLAKPAEMNHYPGPKHVLELGADLKLTSEQQEQVTTTRASMLSEAKALGVAIVEAERSLDAAFAGGKIDRAALDELTARIARLQGTLRAVHLAAHLRTREILTADQVKKYDTLRGYH